MRKNSPYNKWYQNNQTSIAKKNRPWPKTHTLYKNEHKMGHRSKCKTMEAM